MEAKNSAKMSRREFLKLAGAASVASLVAACGPAPTPTLPPPTATKPPAPTAVPTPTAVPPTATPAPPVKVTFGYEPSGNIQKYYDAVLASAPQDLPGITVVPVVYPTYDAELSQLPNQFAAGTAPNVIRWDNAAPWTEYATAGVLLPLQDLVKQTKIDLSAFPKALVDGWTLDGKLYAIPTYLQNSAFVYNLDLLGQAGITTMPTSMQEVRQAAMAVKQKTGKAGLVILPALFHLHQYVLAFGGGWNYGHTIDSPQNEAGLQFLVDMFVKDGTAATASQLGASWDGEALSQNKAAMSDGGPWYIGFMKSAAPNVKYSLVPIPTSTAGQSFVVTYGGGYSVSASSKDPPAVMKLVEFLSTDAAQKAIITTNLGFVPAMSKFLPDYVAVTPEYAAFTESVLSQGRTLDYPPKVSEFETDLLAGFEQLVFKPGTTTVPEVLQSLASKYGV
jgi:multiple sugar transport system substrate-binding protein